MTDLKEIQGFGFFWDQSQQLQTFKLFTWFNTVYTVFYFCITFLTPFYVNHSLAMSNLPLASPTYFHNGNLLWQRLLPTWSHPIPIFMQSLYCPFPTLPYPLITPIPLLLLLLYFSYPLPFWTNQPLIYL